MSRIRTRPWALSAAVGVTLLASVVVGAGPAANAAASDVVINEVCTSTVGAANGLVEEYIELTNTGASNESIGGWTVRIEDVGKTVTISIPSGTTLSTPGFPGSFWTIGNSQASGVWDQTYTWDSPGMTEAATVILRDGSGNEIDRDSAPHVPC